MLALLHFSCLGTIWQNILVEDPLLEETEVSQSSDMLQLSTENAGEPFRTLPHLSYSAIERKHDELS